MIRKPYLIMVVIFILLLTGCWNRTELNERGIVAGYGVDLSENKDELKLTAQIILPSGIAGKGGGGKMMPDQNAVEIVSATDKSIFGIDRQLVLQTGRKLFDAHSQVIIIGEAAAEKGFENFIDFFAREHEIRLRNWIIVAKGTAEDILTTKFKIERIPAFGISNMIKSASVTSLVAQVTLKDFFEKITGSEKVAYLPGIKKIRSENGEEKLMVADTAILKDGKLVGWFDSTETRGLLWVLGNIQSGIIELESPDKKGEISIEILEGKSKIKPKFTEKGIIFSVKITESGRIGEFPANSQYISKQGLKIIEHLVTIQIKKEIERAIHKAQELKTDVFGFGQSIAQNNPKEWKKIKQNWEEIFPAIHVEIEVSAKINYPGLITHSLKIK